MKNWKHFTVLVILAVFAIVVGFVGCDGDTCNHNWQWVVATPATLEADGLETETCSICGETKGTRPIPRLELEETVFRNFSDQLMFSDNDVDYLADIIDARTGARYETLEQLGIVEQLKDSISGAFTAGNTARKNRFRNVFTPEVINTKGKVRIIIENNVTYESYEVDDSANVRFNFDYLLSVSDADLQDVIDEAIREMVNKINGE